MINLNKGVGLHDVKYVKHTAICIDCEYIHKQQNPISIFFLQIYICGGFKGQTFLQTAECYNPNTNQWTMITPMIRRRCEHGVVAHAGCVYAVSTLNITMFGDAPNFKY